MEGPVLGFIFVSVLKFIFEGGPLHCHFALDPANYVAGPVYAPSQTV